MSRKFLVLCGITLLIAFPIAYEQWLATRPSRSVDRDMADAGRELFLHEWTPNDPLSPKGDGLGPVFNASSCVACHRQGGAGGSGAFDTNVNVFTIRKRWGGGQPRQGVVHTQAIAPEFQETLAHVDQSFPSSFPHGTDQRSIVPSSGVLGLTMPGGINVSQRKTPALFGAKLIDEIPDREIIANERAQSLRWGMAPSTDVTVPVGRALRLASGRVGHFGWKAQTVSLVHFVRAACANELGLGNPGQSQPQPLGMPGYQAPGYDLTLEQCDQLAEFIASLPRPLERMPEHLPALEDVQAGKELFRSVGCADCHQPEVGQVKGLYSDLLLHRMGQSLEGGGDYNDAPLEDPDFSNGTGPHPTEWRTPPLWGVSRSAPYLHDGRAKTLTEAISLHGGQGTDSAKRFHALSPTDQKRLLAFLNTLDTP